MSQTPPIQKKELKTWEDRFKTDVYPFVKFMKFPLSDKQQESNEDDVTMQLYQNEGGVEATWHGKIMLQSDKFIYWEFSLNKNPVIQSDIILDNEMVELMKKILDYYISWKNYWLQALSDKPTIQEVRGKNRNSKFIIENHSYRMKKLAGL